MRTPEDAKGRGLHRVTPRLVYDFQLCYGIEELKLALLKINSFNFHIVAVTQDAGEYTVIFQRPLQ